MLSDYIEYYRAVERVKTFKQPIYVIPRIVDGPKQTSVDPKQFLPSFTFPADIHLFILSAKKF